MYEEEVKQFFTAKRMAAKRILGSRNGRKVRYRPRDLPSNGEIQAALLELARSSEGELHEHRLFALRVTALVVMEQLLTFTPRLIGSVSTGHVRRGSDIDIHVFPDQMEELEQRLDALGWDRECRQVSIQKNNQIRDYNHIYLEQDFPVELSVYEPNELRVTQRSSTDGKPIVRISLKALRDMILAEHPEAWREYQQTGRIPMLEEVMEDEGIHCWGISSGQALPFLEHPRR